MGRREYLRAIHARYRRSKPEEKGSILDEFCRTPLERLQANSEADREVIARLIALRDATDPFVLSKTIEDKLARIYDLAGHRNSSDRVTSQTA